MYLYKYLRPCPFPSASIHINYAPIQFRLATDEERFIPHITNLVVWDNRQSKGLMFRDLSIPIRMLIPSDTISSLVLCTVLYIQFHKLHHCPLQPLKPELMWLRGNEHAPDLTWPAQSTQSIKFQPASKRLFLLGYVCMNLICRTVTRCCSAVPTSRANTHTSAQHFGMSLHHVFFRISNPIIFRKKEGVDSTEKLSKVSVWRLRRQHRQW